MPAPPTAILERPLPAEAVDRVARILLDAAPAGSRVILFGSYARGEPGEGSDLDFMVVEPEPPDPVRESTRLRRLLRPLRVSADIIAVGSDRFQQWSQRPGTIHEVADREGRVYEQHP